MNTRTERLRAEASAEALVGPIRGELLGTDHLAARARAVARGQRLVVGRRPLRQARLLARLGDTKRILSDAFVRLAAATAQDVDAGPAAEWLLDNYHVVQEHLQEVRASLPGSFYRELPELSAGPLTGYPRVYEMAISLISHTEARVDLENVNLYVEAFQSVTPLSIGELWAMPAMLRLGLIESVRRMTLRTVQRLDELAVADSSAARIVAARARGGSELRAALRQFSEEDHSLSPHFVSRFLQALRHSEGSSPALAWIEHWLRDAGVSPEQAAAQSTQRLALTQIMMANSITSLRGVGRYDWHEFVESQSAMEAVLRADPSGFYGKMTFITRDCYRHVAEKIAKQTGHRDAVVAQWAVDLARAYTPDATRDLTPYRAHIGYYLVDDGLPALEQMAGYRPTLFERVIRSVRAFPNRMFVGGFVLCTLLAVLAAVQLLEAPARESLWLVLLFTIGPALDIALSAVNQLVTTLLPPRVLPRIDLHEHGVPAEYKTAVVMPTLFGTVDDVHRALDNLEVQFLANREAHLHFAVLSDFTDAATQATPDDDAIVRAAVDGIVTLNERYATGQRDAFHLLHRPRKWNERQGVWMGWERKRGKLAEFNLLLRGGASDAFSVQVGDVTMLRDVRFVITLDADTVLPPDAAPSLVGAMAHPLNRAVYDPARARIVRGYGILQPRVGISLPSAHGSRFAAIASGYPGVDPYSTAVSDVYQDLYGEGSFTGKGIYDVDAFQLATHGRFPENALLSHDLIEGNYARAGLATDVIVYDDYPASYVAATKRAHRWIRGDWQLLPWLRRTVPGPNGPERNRLSMLSQWKILDNLRRSTLELSLVMLFIGGWTVLPGSAVRWTLLGVGALVAPWATALLVALLRPPFDNSWRAYYTAISQDAAQSVGQVVITLVFLAHRAVVSGDAIVRTLYRLAISHRQLLQWQTASLVERSLTGMRGESWRAMRGMVLGVSVMAIAISLFALRLHVQRGLPFNGQPLRLLVTDGVAMWSIVLLWLSAPRIADRLNRATVPARRRLSASARETAQRYAAAHWHFFETFVSAETHWLAPDNFQDVPAPVVAMRTSPTNMGLQLLATVSAYDLGLITVDVMTTQLERTLDTLQKLDRYRGHFYNWYDLHEARVLEPRYISTVDSGNIAGHLIALRQGCIQLATVHPTVAHRLRAVAEVAYALVVEMDFTFLYDDERKLFTIGYHTDSLTRDDSFYDLLASEARLASFVAIAKNDVPVEHWFRLSRALNRTAGATALVSWSGSMFEYLMPVLVMRSLPFTLLDQTYRGAVARHRSYGRTRHMPWGVSESAYNVRDRQQTYQYRAFGVPDLALKRGLGRELVIAPYASALAAQVDPARALSNLRAMESMGALSAYGFCDAIDYTRPAPGERFAFVRAFMAHHVGMTLVSLTNVLRDDLWQDRFHADSLVKSAELLLYERVPRRFVMQQVPGVRHGEASLSPERVVPVVREVDPIDSLDIAPTSSPSLQVALLGTAPYSVMLTHTGTGYSRYDGLAVTRWRADATSDDTGQFIYLKDVESGDVWSAAVQPSPRRADWMRVRLASECVTVHRVDGDLETKTEITVVSADAAEVRRVTLVNNGREAREIELTSYGEVVLAPADADRAHPAFSNLFVETEWHAWCSAITATRRPRAASDPLLWCVHVVDAGRDRVGQDSCETDRAEFIGRGRSVRNPKALRRDGTLSGTTGAVLDPIFAIRTRVRVASGQSATVAFTTLVATRRESAFELAGRYHDSHAAQRALDFAWTSTQLELSELAITPASAAVFQEIAAQVLFGRGTLAPPIDELRRNRGSQSRLWAYGLSGDLPIVLALIDSVDGLATLREVFVAHRYWRRRGLRVDLVVLNAHSYDYLQELRDGIAEAMVTSDDATLIDQPGGVFVRRRDMFLVDDYLMLSATARVQVVCDGRTLERVIAGAAEHAEARHTGALLESATNGPPARAAEKVPPMLTVPPTSERAGAIAAIVSALRPLVAPLLPRLLRGRGVHEEQALRDDIPLQFSNGIGGFDAKNDYRMVVDDEHLPPAPWSNVIANAAGGFLVSERGSGCTWAENAYFYRLTPWHNDPLADPICDAIFLRDDDSGDVWSATPAPIDDGTSYRVRHGAGSSTFEHDHDGLNASLLLGLAPNDAVKISVLTLQNDSDRVRNLTVTAYAEWTLGARREDTQHQVKTRYAPEHSAMFATNHFDEHFAEWTAFLATSESVTTYSGDRATFVGAGGALAQPAALAHDTLDGRVGVGLDPCAALQWAIQLAPGESREMSVLLGASRSEAIAARLLEALRPRTAARASVSQTVAEWDTRLGVICVKTPDASFDAMLNKWSLYQALSCRMWARMGFYQSGGAFGFRDQLQDVMAFVYAEPALARAHVLIAAARQFVEGDVQHWWHAHTGRGVRTRFSDDLVWLPYAVDHYVRVTGDSSLLEEYVPFLAMRTLEPSEHELYDLPTVSDEHASVYEHCLRALRRACTVGVHGLPLIGTGDWNDGMSLVGAEGKGESVWLAWFLITTLRAFATHADARHDSTVAVDLRARADRYVEAVEASGWDGQWYRRAYYDDGAPIGSSTSDECSIDSIAQSWSVISGAAKPTRSALAMSALNTKLVRDDARLIMLLTPPFDKGAHNPGYIKGYVPGVRENGAQYTHAALWAVIATAMQGFGDRAFSLFQMLNPLTHTATAADVARYKVEPYVVAADVYTAASHDGRGGWTWYTGSASWMYRAGLEHLLGVTKVGATLRIMPCVPRAWPEYEVAYRYGAATYRIRVLRPDGIQRTGARITVDGVTLTEPIITLLDDGREHAVRVEPLVG